MEKIKTNMRSKWSKKIGPSIFPDELDKETLKIRDFCGRFVSLTV